MKSVYFSFNLYHKSHENISNILFFSKNGQDDSLQNYKKRRFDSRKVGQGGNGQISKQKNYSFLR